MTEDAKNDIDETLASFATVLDKLEQRYKEEEQNMTQQTSRDAGSDDEPRDPHGRWTSGGGGEEVQHPDWMHGSDGQELAGPNDISDGADAVEDARSDLEEASDEASNLSEEEDDYDEGTKEYAEWEKRHNAALANVADKTMALHKAISSHIENTTRMLARLTGKINEHAQANGVRGR